MTSWWDKKAADLHRMGFEDYPHNPDDAAYTLQLHSRQDLVLVVSYLSSVNKQLFHIKVWLAVIAAILAYLAIRVSSLL